MNINQLPHAPEVRIQFDRSNYNEVPQESGCYVLTTYGCDILYIGKSKNINQRFMQHLDDQKKTCETIKGSVFWFYWIEWDEEQIGELENGWLNDHKTREGERPIMNLIDAPV